ncbi:helix-turn-helix domain-containing protein [Oryzomicrobium sp.]|uniref:helix-turn-helix domain-containing protein n=1 Tax=Oryzomicrobium sp. TaxID=1911578 RepID=UPI002FE3D2BB
MQQQQDLGTRLRSAREDKKMRQEDVAAFVGVTQQAVQAWEANRSTPRGLQKIAKLAEVLGLEPADIRNELPQSPPSFPPALEKRVKEFAASVFAPMEGRAIGVSALHDERRAKRRSEIALNLPDELQKSVFAAIDVRGTPYYFDYLSRRVVAVFMHLPEDSSRLSMTAARFTLYRFAIANRHYNDFPVPDRHYLLAVVGEHSQEVQLPRPIRNEAALFDVALEMHKDMESACKRVVELEGIKTEMEELMDAQEYLKDLDWPDIDLDSGVAL